MSERDVLRRRQQLLDRFLAGEIDQATYDRMLAEIERLSAAAPPLARPVVPQATARPEAKPAAGARLAAAPIVQAPTAPAPSGTRGNVGVVLGVIGGVLAVVFLLVVVVWLGSKLFTNDRNVVATGPQPCGDGETALGPSTIRLRLHLFRCAAIGRRQVGRNGSAAERCGLRWAASPPCSPSRWPVFMWFGLPINS